MNLYFVEDENADYSIISTCALVREIANGHVSSSHIFVGSLPRSREAVATSKSTKMSVA